MTGDHQDGYTGPAVLVVDGRDVPVQVTLDARHEPQDGRLHWFGRLSADLPDGAALADSAGLSDGAGLSDVPGLSRAVDLARGAELELRTDGGRALARLGEPDPWGRYRVTGVGRPPYALDDPDLDDPDAACP